MDSFTTGFKKQAAVSAKASRALSKGIAALTGTAGGAMLGTGLGIAAKGVGKDSFADKEKPPIKEKILDSAPMVLGLAGAALGAKRGLRSVGKKGFDKGFGKGKSGLPSIKNAALGAGAIALKAVWENTFHGLGDNLGSRAGVGIHESMADKRKNLIVSKTLAALKADDRATEEDHNNLDQIVSIGGVQDRAAEVAAGAGLALAGYGILHAFKPSTQQAGIGAKLFNQAHRAIRGPKFKPSLGNLALALAAGSFATGLVTSLANPIAAQALGNATARMREKDIQKGVERYFDQKTASLALKSFGVEKTAASVIGVLSGVTSGLKSTSSHGTIRMAKTKANQSIGPRSKPSHVPSPTTPPNAGQPGAATEMSSSARLPTNPTYGSRLMGSWM